MQHQEELFMKRLLIFTVAAMSILFAGTALGAAPKKTKGFSFVGKLKPTVQLGSGISLTDEDGFDYEMDERELKKATPEFQQCLGGGKHKGLVEITTTKKEIPGVHHYAARSLKLDKNSTCKRK
jgi:hypothetical protein